MTFEESKMMANLEEVYPFYPKGCSDPETLESGYEIGYRAGQAESRELVERMKEALGSVEIKGGCFCGKHIPDSLHAAYCRKAKTAIAEADKFLGRK